MSTNVTRRVRGPAGRLLPRLFVRPVDFGGGPVANMGDGCAADARNDVKENADGYEVHAELPGMKKEDIHVHIDGPVVSISAERKQEKEVKEGEKVLRTERYFGKVSCSFQLGQEIDEAKASPGSTTASSNWRCRRRPKPRPSA